MNDLISLAMLIKWATRDEICIFSLSTDVQWSSDGSNYTRYWEAVLQTAAGMIISHPEQTIEGASRNLIEMCKQQEIEIPEVIDPETIIPYYQEVAVLITNLYNVLPKLEWDYHSILFTYYGSWPSTEQAWKGEIYPNTRWTSHTEVEVKGYSLFEVCTKLWGECLKKLEK